MKNFRELTEATGTVVFTFGRFNPPTTGHEKLIKKVASVAGSNPFRIYPSYSQNPKKDPLPFALKIAYMRKMFPKYARNIVADTDARTAINIAVKLHDEGFKNLVMVAGSDRVKEFQSLLTTYNGVGGKRHGFYKFDMIDVVSAGERDPDAEGVTGMSASKMRAAASNGDFESFSQGLPSGFRDGKKLYLDVRKNMGIREQRDMGEMNDLETLRDMYLTGQIWNVGDLVEANGVEGKVIRKGTNYLSFNDRDGKVHKAWLHEVKQDKDVKKRKGTQPAKYYAKDAEGDELAKSTKQARARHFEKGKTGPAPGDARGKTKPSKHTKKFKQMYGEINKDEINEIPALAVPIAVGALRAAPAVAKVISRGGGAPVGAAAASAVDKVKSGIRKVRKRLSRRREEFEVDENIDERNLTKSQQDRLDDLEAYLGHLQRLRTPRTAEIDATKKKIAKLKSEFDPEDNQEDLDEVRTRSKVPAQIKRQLMKLYTAYKGERKGSKEAKSMLNVINSIRARAEKDFKHKGVKLPPLDDNLDVKEDLDEMTGFNVPELIRTTVHRLTHPKGYDDIIQKYIQDVCMEKQKSGHQDSNGAVLADVAKLFGFDRVKPIQDYVNKLVRRGKLPQALAAEYEIDEEFQLDEKITALVNKAKKSGMPYGILKKVYDRGMAAYKTGHRPGATPQQWALARVNSFTTKSSGTWGKADKDLADKVRASEEVEVDESLWKNIQKKRARIARGSGERMRKKGEKGAPTAAQMKRAKEENEWGEIEEEAEYDGRPVKLNNPTRGDTKKYKVYVRNEKGNVIKLEFGDPNMEIKRDDPERRKAFRARHGCDVDPGPKYKAKYWSCKFWEKGKSVTDLMKG